MGDTGNFKYISYDQVSIFSAISKLIQDGRISIELLNSKYGGMKKEDYSKFAPIYAHIIDNSQIRSMTNWPDFMTSYVDRDFIEMSSFSYEDAAEAAHIFLERYGKSIEGVSWGFVARPKEKGETSVSFRSLPGSVNVRKIVEDIKVGGGHDHASGASIKVVNSKKALEMIIDYLKENKPEFV